MTSPEQKKWQFIKWDAVLGPKFISPDGQQWSMGSKAASNTSGYALAALLSRYAALEAAVTDYKALNDRWNNTDWSDEADYNRQYAAIARRMYAALNGTQSEGGEK